jgi:rhodanese-related sulfurtransferase
VVLTAMATPGHTPEHISWVARYDGAVAPEAVFTGGSLMVGSSGRTDLLGPDRTDQLTRAQYGSLQRLASLPASAAVLPTHGAGSFCGASATPSKRTSTIQKERGSNPALNASDVDAFVTERLSGLMEYPAYYRHMAPINRAGAALLRDLPEPEALDAEGLARAAAKGAWVVDARRREDFASAHVPGSLNIELDEAFGTYVGWLVPWGAAVVLVLPDGERGTLREAWTQLIRIGWDRVEGYLDGGIDAWRSAGREASAYGTATLDDLCAHVRSEGSMDVLDVRQPTEWAEGVIPGSRTIFVGDLRDRVGELPTDREQWAICRTGHRASIAASVLDRVGVPVRLITKGGVPDWLETCQDF